MESSSSNITKKKYMLIANVDQNQSIIWKKLNFKFKGCKSNKNAFGIEQSIGSVSLLGATRIS